jgi:hypothetical protein
MDLLNMAHNHMLLNHVPTVGTVIGIGLLLLGLVRQSDDLKHASLEVFCVVALLTLPAYLTGAAAQAAIANREGVSAEAIDAHHSAALTAFVLMNLTGFVAWIALWRLRRRPAPTTTTTWGAPLVLLLSVLTLAVMAPAATLGGEIRHPEIRLSEDAAPGAGIPGMGWLSKASVQEFVTGHPPAWAAAETLHFLGACLMFGVLLVVNLRLMGFMNAIPFSALHRLLPWAMLGFGVNLITGMTFFIASSEQYIRNVPFYWKIVFLVLAGLNLLYVTVADRVWSVEAGHDTTVFDKAIALSVIVLWLGVIYWGRMLPFLGDAF